MLLRLLRMRVCSFLKMDPYASRISLLVSVLPKSSKTKEKEKFIPVNLLPNITSTKENTF